MRHSGGFLRILLALLPVAACASGAPLELPRIGTVGDFPPAAATLAITVLRDGRLVHAGAAITYVEFEALLQAEVAARPKQHLSASLDLSELNLLLRAAREVPYGVVLQLLHRCCHPDVGVNRVFFAVRSDDDGGEGALAMFLPTDPGHFELHPTETWSSTIRGDAPASDPGALYEAAATALASQPPEHRKDAQFTVEAAGDVALGSVLRCADAALRAGFHAVFLGVPLPPIRTQLPGISFQGRDLGQTRAQMPRLPRVHGAFAGNADSTLVHLPPPPPPPPEQPPVIKK